MERGEKIRDGKESNKIMTTMENSINTARGRRKEKKKGIRGANEWKASQGKKDNRSKSLAMQQGENNE